MNLIKSLRETAKANSFLLVTAAVFVAAVEIFMGIMQYNLHISEIGTAAFCKSIVLRVFALLAGIVIAYFFCGLLNHELSGAFSAFLTIFAVITSTWEVGYAYSNAYNICIVTALLSLSFYYTNQCESSLKHTIFYYAMMLALAVATVDKIEFFAVVAVALLMFASNRASIEKKSVAVANGIGAVAAVAAIACAAVDHMDAYLGIVCVEGISIHPEIALLSGKMFGTAKYFVEIADAPAMYNLAKIFSCFGYAAGTAMCVVIALFIAAVGFKCFNCPKWARNTSLVAAAVLSIGCITGFMENFTIISGLYCGIPLLSEGSGGYFVFGILLGAMVAPHEHVELMHGVFKSAFLSIFKKEHIENKIDDLYNIERFYDVHRIYYEDALNEIKAGQKVSHWMWYIFPQLKSLGQSYKAVYFGLENAEEAKAFYDDSCLGANLKEICAALLECESSDALEVMGSPDNLKLRSSMTLFLIATGDKIFSDVLDKFYNGEPDEITVNQLIRKN